MWIFTRYGFFSFVCSRSPEGNVDSETMVVRARAQDHLKLLQDRFPDLAAGEVLSTPDGDYPYRLIVAKQTWAAVVLEMVSEVNWSNFRSAAAGFQGEEGQHYLDAIHDVWDRMAHL